ncbi:MAG: FAD-dependent oxidoreductase, partial [Gemmatimonadota bacterium]
MKRRSFLRLLGGLGVSSLAVRTNDSFATPRSYDVAVVGGGVFGIWTASYLHRAGKRVAVIDAFGPANRAASSGGESRVTRCGYGAEELYTEWACRSMAEWRGLSDRTALPLFHEMGVLWIHRDGDEFFESNANMLTRHGIPFSRWPARELRTRFPVLRLAEDEAGFFEPRGGGLMARRAVLQMAVELESAGVTFLQGQVAPIHAAEGIGGAGPARNTAAGAGKQTQP